MKKFAIHLFLSAFLFGMGVFVLNSPGNAEASSQKWNCGGRKMDSASTKGGAAGTIIILNIPSEPVVAGTRIKLSATVHPAKSKKKILWSSSKKSVARVTSKGVVRACKKGTTVITARIKNTRKKAVFKLRVKAPIKLKKIVILGRNQVTVGNSVQLTEKLYPKNTTDRDIIWKTSNKKLAEVDDDGLVTAKKTGNVTITAKERKRKKSKKFKIKILKIPVTDVCFSSSNKTSMEIGTKIPLSVQVMPQNATNRILKWKSSDSSVATVDKKGVVTALRPIENVTITATSADNKKIYCTWNIKITIDDGYITRAMLDRLDLTSIHKVMFVAHPDDETLWGGAHLLEDEYLVVCMTNGWNAKRKSAFFDIMRKSNDKGIILDYPDIKRRLGNGKYEADQFSTCLDAMKKDIGRVLSYKKWEQVITHNPFGEYGKYHHQQISKAVTNQFHKLCKRETELWYFGRYYAQGKVPGEKIEPELLLIKNTMVARYYPTAVGAIVAFGHMIPYENWISADKW